MSEYNPEVKSFSVKAILVSELFPYDYECFIIAIMLSFLREYIYISLDMLGVLWQCVSIKGPIISWGLSNHNEHIKGK